MDSLTHPAHEDVDAFYAVCNDHDVRVQEGILAAVNNTIEDGTPTGILSAIKNAGEHLREDSNRPLADSLINPAWGFADNVQARTLIEIINASVEKPAPPATSVQFNCRPAEQMDVCAYAELCFLRAFTGLEYMYSDRSVPYGCQVFTNHSGRAVFVRKGLGNETALSLKEVYVNGIPYPAGSIFSLEGGEEAEPLSDSPEHKVQELTLRSLGRVSFLRLSEFALPLAERQAAKFYVHQNAKDYEAENLATVELTDFVTAANNVLQEMCEDEPISLAV